MKGKVVLEVEINNESVEIGLNAKGLSQKGLNLVMGELNFKRNGETPFKEVREKFFENKTSEIHKFTQDLIKGMPKEVLDNMSPEVQKKIKDLKLKVDENS